MGAIPKRKPRGAPPAASPRPCAVSGAREVRGGPAGVPPKPAKSRAPRIDARTRAGRAALAGVPRGTRALEGDRPVLAELRAPIREATALDPEWECLEGGGRRRGRGCPEAAGPRIGERAAEGAPVDLSAGPVRVRTPRDPASPGAGSRAPRARAGTWAPAAGGTPPQPGS